MTVKQAQHLLAYLGYYVGIVDGIWGTMSKTAAKMFQKDFGGIEENGRLTQETEKALQHSVAYGMKTTAKKEPAGWDNIQWFTPDEFACKCGLYHAPYCDGYPAQMDMRVVNICEAVRKHFNTPVEIISGLRCRQHNADSGGHVNSQHMDGTACDIYVKGVSPATVESYLDEIGGVRYHYHISGSQNVHFDITRG